MFPLFFADFVFDVRFLCVDSARCPLPIAVQRFLSAVVSTNAQSQRVRGYSSPDPAQHPHHRARRTSPAAPCSSRPLEPFTMPESKFLHILLPKLSFTCAACDRDRKDESSRGAGACLSFRRWLQIWRKERGKKTSFVWALQQNARSTAAIIKCTWCAKRLQEAATWRDAISRREKLLRQEWGI